MMNYNFQEMIKLSMPLQPLYSKMINCYSKLCDAEKVDEYYLRLNKI